LFRLCYGPFPPNTPSGQLTPSMLQSKFMILLLQHHPGSSTSISTPSLQPLISPSFSLLQHPILRIIFNHLSPSHSFSFLSHTHTRQIRSGILYNNGICILFYNQITLGSNHPPKLCSEFCALTMSPRRASIK